MSEEKNKYRHMRAAAHLTQFGLNMVSPIILCLIAALWIKNTFNTGNWVAIVAIILGVSASVLNMFSFIKAVKKEMGGEHNDKKREN